jgi:hypothetical protein
MLGQRGRKLEGIMVWHMGAGRGHLGDKFFIVSKANQIFGIIAKDLPFDCKTEEDSVDIGRKHRYITVVFCFARRRSLF